MRSSHKYGYGECQRSGRRVPLSELVRDGQHPGLLVARDERDPRHPQDIPFNVRPEIHDTPAPELSKPEGEGEAAPPLEFDEDGRLI